MNKMRLIAVCFFVLCSLPIKAQSISSATVDHYKQILAWHQRDFESCSNQLTQWGYEYNRGNTINMFTVTMHQFMRMTDVDTVGAVLSEMEGVVNGVSGIYSSVSPSKTFSLVVKAAEMQQKLAAERGLTKYVCMIKGDVKNKRPKTHEELMQVLAEESSETVRMFMEMWKSEDGKQAMTITYDNKRYGKKKPREDACAELTLGYSITPER